MRTGSSPNTQDVAPSPDNAIIESFNGTLRDECLNVNWFLSVDDAREKIAQWCQEYNEFRPHSSLGDLTPSEFAHPVPKP